MKYIFCLFLSIFIFSQTPKVSSGELVEYPHFLSQYIGNRMVRVWLPESYNPNIKHQVLYVNDGQMLWDASINWNQQEWRLDENMAKLIGEKK